MKIVVLDAFTLNPGDLSWESLKELGECKIYNRTSSAEIIERAEEADILLTNKTPISGETISKLPYLKYIGLLSTGYDVVDIVAAKKKNIVVTNILTYGTSSVAQMVFAHIFNLTQHVGMHAESVKNGEWLNSKDFCYWTRPLIELREKILGIIGFGKIGKEVAKIALAFGMKVIVHDRFIEQNSDCEVLFVELATLLEESDFVSLHCPLTSDTYRFLNGDKIQRMKRSAFLINTSRGLLIDEAALADALNKEKIAGAGLDVLSKEPPIPENPLPKARNCFITPHIAWATIEARTRLMKIAVKNIQMFLSGDPINVVN
ncbi:MAG: D-2-hydroxyacid dehydrogenase [Bacteroidales bacterium]|nr:D-2-hydroxyacid dehydrogenase [Bacteroidales bacterium]